MLQINDNSPQTLFDVTCNIYDANMMLRTIAELDPFQDRDIPCWVMGEKHQAREQEGKLYHIIFGW